MDINPNINPAWKELLIDEFQAPYFLELKKFLLVEKSQYVIYPSGSEIFNAYDHTPPEKVKVVIIGQDPYHGPGQAHGLCFSVKKGIKPPPSLVNIFKEIHTDLGLPVPAHGDLSGWANQGVLLLNATLTVRARQAGSHQKKGWENFTDATIKKVSDFSEGVVFLLWGRFAQAKENLIDTKKHHVLKAAHPSPFSVHNGFFGCRHFSKTNEILKKQGKTPIDWSL